jgi:small subunit ribosomal protein S7
MSRSGKLTRRSINVDPIYQSIIVHTMVKHLITNGKKSRSYRILYLAIEKIYKTTQREPTAILEHAVRAVSPTVQIKSRRVRGAVHQVPEEIRPRDRIITAIKWILHGAKRRSEPDMVTRIANEILDASSGTGNSIRKREIVHRIAEANKAFARYRFLRLLFHFCKFNEKRKTPSRSAAWRKSN